MAVTNVFPVATVDEAPAGPAPDRCPAEGDALGLLLVVQTLTAAHDRCEAERSDITSSQNSAGDDGENRDLNLPKD
ncbi:hypothetical protein GTZ89_17015 [Streptomyces sp. SID8382]|uniref:hypothetical protein n=1 Tax=Streptomyces malaysiensis TaxID=92644 RepID=UPI000CA36AD6|nr:MULTISPECIES: hypothetical protein [unclassified Streptomyces]AUA16515.1 hypothetical protein CFP59_08706 [Streptomyces sp. M56]MYX57341.1 hypothetical protein [Streptomyces sp. SID8382]